MLREKSEKGFITILASTLILASISSGFLGYKLADGPATEKDYMETAAIMQEYICNCINKQENIESVVKEAEKLGKKYNLKVGCTELSNRYDFIISMPLDNKVVTITIFEVYKKIK